LGWLSRSDVALAKAAPHFMFFDGFFFLWLRVAMD
jgi:hypothetical protein